MSTQKILGPGELDDSAVSSNCPTWMTQNIYVPLAARPDSPSVRDKRRNEKLGPVGRAALMESIVNMQETEHQQLKPIQQRKRYMRTSNIKTFYVPQATIPDPTMGSWGVHAKLSNSQKIKKFSKSQTDLQPTFGTRHKEVYDKDPATFKMRLGSCASFGMSIKNSKPLLRKYGIGVLPSIERKQERMRRTALSRAVSCMRKELKQLKRLQSTQALRASQSDSALSRFHRNHIGNFSTEIDKLVSDDEMKHMIRGAKILFAPVPTRSQRSTSRSRGTSRSRKESFTGRNSKNGSSRKQSGTSRNAGSSRKNSFAGSDAGEEEVDDRPQYVFEQQLAEQTREQLLHILGYQYCAEKCKVAAIARLKRLDAEARKNTNVYDDVGQISKFGRQSITNFFETKFSGK
jgi:hypothetical protein